MLDKELEKTNFFSQILGGVFVVGGLVISVLQYISSNVEATIIKEKEKKVRAAEMANQFQKEIIPLANILAGAYAKSGLNEKLLSKIATKKLEMFNREEILAFVSVKDIRRAMDDLYAGYLIDHCTEKNIGDKDGEQGLVFSSSECKVAEEEINVCINNLANGLEYFCICFNSGIADDDTVYQSLHQVFFQCVHMLYVFIFFNNISEYDRLYSNIMMLYLRWHERYENLMEKEEKELADMKKNVKENIVVKAKK